MKKLFAVLALSLLTVAANAEVQSPAWVCTMNFNGRAVGARLIIGMYKFNGRGTLRCANPTGQTEQIPVLVSMNAKPISLGASLGYMDLYGQTAEAALVGSKSRGASALLGDYYVAQAQAAIIGGAGVITAVHAQNSALSLKIALQLTKGFGVNLGFNRMRISLDHSRSRH